ncbi:hypothetical protein ACNOYE_05005 [Nannocystaceae bacterium ST9]
MLEIPVDHHFVAVGLRPARSDEQLASETGDEFHVARETSSNSA